MKNEFKEIIMDFPSKESIKKSGYFKVKSVQSELEKFYDDSREYYQKV